MGKRNTSLQKENKKSKSNSSLKAKTKKKDSETIHKPRCPKSKSYKPKRKLRNSNSLELLTKRFLKEIKGKTEIDINEINEKLKLPKRRIYDITNVLEGINLIKKKGTRNKFEVLNMNFLNKSSNLSSSIPDNETASELIQSNLDYSDNNTNCNNLKQKTINYIMPSLSNSQTSSMSKEKKLLSELKRCQELTQKCEIKIKELSGPENQSNNFLLAQDFVTFLPEKEWKNKDLYIASGKNLNFEEDTVKDAKEKAKRLLEDNKNYKHGFDENNLKLFGLEHRLYLTSKDNTKIDMYLIRNSEEKAEDSNLNFNEIKKEEPENKDPKNVNIEHNNLL